MKDSEVCLEAARIIAEGEKLYCCNALFIASGRGSQLDRIDETFEGLFKPDDCTQDQWFGNSNSQDVQDHRTLALLFTAEYLKQLGK